MELALFVYVAGIVGQLSSALGFVCFAVLLIVGVATFLWLPVMGEDYSKEYKKLYKKIVTTCLPIFILCGAMNTLLPNEKTLYMMAAGYGTQAVVQSETADKVLKIVNGKLDEYLAEMEKSVKEGAK